MFNANVRALCLAALSAAVLAACSDNSGNESIPSLSADQGELNDQNTVFMTSGSLGLLRVAEIANQGLNPESALALMQGRADFFSEKSRCQQAGFIQTEVVDGNTLILHYHDCSELGRSLTGTVTYAVTDTGPNSYRAQVAFDQLRVETASKLELVEGKTLIHEQLQSGRYRVSASLQDIAVSDGHHAFQAVEAEGVHEVDANGTQTNRLDGYVVASGVGLMLDTLTPISTRANSAYPYSGDIEVTALLDGSRLRINADSGRAETALVTNLDAGGAVVSQLLNWSDL